MKLVDSDLMPPWYHNLIHSDEKRISRRILFDQMAEESDNWWNQLSKWADEMEIDLKVEHIQKRNKPNVCFDHYRLKFNIMKPC